MGKKFPDSDEIEKIVESEYRELERISAQNTDLVSLVLRAHLLSEYQLERMIIAFLPRGDRVIEKGRMKYSQKLELANGFDILPDRIVGALRKLNRLRNDCSHERDATISISDIEKVGRPLGTHFTEIKRKFGEDVREFFLATFERIYRESLKKLIPLEFKKELNNNGIKTA